MTSPKMQKYFLNKRFFLYVRHSDRHSIDKSAELIKLFGGQIEQFLDNEVNYLLTDVPKSEWPPHGDDRLLNGAYERKIKLMSLQDLLVWCSQYVSSQSSSEDDDDLSNVNELQPPLIKFEDMTCRYAPSVKEFIHWPEITINTSLTVGRSFFSDTNVLGTPNHSVNNIQQQHYQNNSAQLTQQAASFKNNTPNVTSASLANLNGFAAMTPTAKNNTGQNRVKRRHSVFCEICNIKINDRIEEHIQTQTHKINTDKIDWRDVDSVIESLPSLNTINMRRITNLTPPNGLEHQEFLCLHKVDTNSQLQWIAELAK